MRRSSHAPAWAAAVALGALWSPWTSAGVPEGPWPACGPDEPTACPSDFGNWSQISWVPENSRASVRAEELTLGSGIALDRAFRHTGGRWDTTIAVLDSGVLWAKRDLVRKIWLNRAELPQPLDATGALVPEWDLDGNGLLNIDDYAEDPRVDPAAGVDSADELLDPSDLIYTFSDGVDDDGNGFVDDIAGWDAFGWDNDPFAELETGYASHGTGVAREAASSADDGSGVGVCPNCAIVFVRVGDSFISDGDRVALGLSYARAIGADVAAMAIGAISHPEAARRSVDEADASGMVLVGAAGDENAYHRNFPAVQAPILYVHSVRGDTMQEGDGGVYSFMSHWNCNNFGPRMDLVAPSTACATGAVAKTAGAAGLIIAAAREQGLELAPEEVRALITTTVDDVFLTDEALEISGTYPSAEGWDAYFGYGRLSVGRAVEAVVAGEIPPIARIVEPAWFAWPGDELVVTGRVAAPRDAVASWELALGTGLEPGLWTPVASGGAAAEGELARLTTTAWQQRAFEDLLGESLLERVVRAHLPLFTLRLRVTDSAGRTTEDRRGIWIHRDPSTEPGYPLDLGSSIEASPQLDDLDGDGIFEVIVGTSDGRIHVLDGEGEAWPGFPVAVDAIPGTEQLGDFAQGMIGTPAVGDMDGDGRAEIVAATLWGEVVAWSADGERIEGFPVAIDGRAPEEFGPGRAWDRGVVAAPTLADLTGDGRLEVIVAGADQRLYVWDAEGERLAGYPLELCQPETCGARVVSSPAIGDVDGDGDLEIVIGTNEVPIGGAGLLYLIDVETASVVEGWPKARDGLINQSILPIIGEGHVTSVALADVDGDGDLEIFSNPMLATNPLMHHDGTEVYPMRYAADGYGAEASFLEGSVISMVNNPVFADLDGDGMPDPITGGASPTYLVSLALASVLDYQHGVMAWSGATGEALPGFPRQMDDVAFLAAVAVGDITGDRVPEVVYSSGGHFVYAADASGAVAPGYPKLHGGWAIATPALGDIDGDGLLEVVIGTREGAVFAWHTEGAADTPVQWSGIHHDPRNTSRYGAWIRSQEGPGPAETGGGCLGGGAAMLVLLPMFGRRRR